MSYVFVPPPPSAKAQRLAQEINKTVESAKRADPNLTVMEINQALRLAQQAAGGSRIVVVLAILAVIGVLVGLIFFFLATGSEF